MKNIFIIIFLTISYSSFAQLNFNINGVVNNKISSEIPEGSKIILKELIYGYDYFNATIVINSEEKSISQRNLRNITFHPTNLEEFWKCEIISNNIHENLTLHGLQYKLRRDLENEANEFLFFIQNNNLLFEDGYLENYLYSLVLKIFPNRINDGRLGILNVKILKDQSPNAFIYSNGTMFITTGLLSTLNSEDELLGVLAHEISHYVLDHSVNNINELKRQERKSEFWTSFATGIAAAAEVYVSSVDDNYSPGNYAMMTSSLANSISAVVEERLGLKYSQKQEFAADEAAAKFLKFVDRNPTALASALRKIEIYCIITGNNYALSGDGSHPSLDDRVKAIGEPDLSLFKNVEYDKSISFVNSYNAMMELNSMRLESAHMLVERNLLAGVASVEDYFILAKTKMLMFDSETNSEDALALIQKGKSLGGNTSGYLIKQEAIVNIKLNKINNAKICLEEYLQSLDSNLANLATIPSSVDVSRLYSNITKEHIWASKMLDKIQNL